VTKDWLYQFLSSCVRAFRDDESEARIENFRRDHSDWPRDEFIRRWVEFRLRQAGVVYGTPLASEETIAFHTSKGYAQRRAVFLAILGTEAELAMEVGCAVSHCTLGNIRVCELLVCFALLCREFRLAEKIHELIPVVAADGAVPQKLLRHAAKVGRVLPRRAYLSGNPLIGLPIHNSFNYVDAKTLGRIAVAYYERGHVDRTAILRVLEYKDREKEHLLRAMVGLTLADRPLGVGSLRVVSPWETSVMACTAVHLLRPRPVGRAAAGASSSVPSRVPRPAAQPRGGRPVAAATACRSRPSGRPRDRRRRTA
jgi:hypothetical protein